MSPFEINLAKCKQLMLAHQYADALKLAEALFKQDQDSLALHLLLATLYARTGDVQRAASHYMLLCQFDPGFEGEHIKELGRGYVQKGHTDLAAMLVHAGAAKLASKELYLLAADYYEQAGETQQAQKLRAAL